MTNTEEISKQKESGINPERERETGWSQQLWNGKLTYSNWYWHIGQSFPNAKVDCLLIN